MTPYEPAMKSSRTARKQQTVGVIILALFLGLAAPPAAANGFATTAPHSNQARTSSRYAALAFSSTPFYKDKTVRVIVPVSPGGSFDLWARLLARHMSKHLAGNPAFVVQNMAGGGGL